VLRDFEPKRPLDVVFEYPVHHVDETGYLREFNILSPQSVGGSKRGEQRAAERDENMTRLEKFCTDYYRDNGTPLSSRDLAQEFGVTPRTIKAWALKAEGLRVEVYGNANYVVLK